jgi:hypothetical protein
MRFYRIMVKGIRTDGSKRQSLSPLAYSKAEAQWRRDRLNAPGGLLWKVPSKAVAEIDMVRTTVPKICQWNPLVDDMRIEHFMETIRLAEEAWRRMEGKSD